MDTEFGKISLLQTSGDPFGREVMPLYVQEYKFDIVVSLLDAFGIDYLQDLDTTTAAYLPIDSESFHRCKSWWGKVYKNDYIIAFSKFGFDQLMKSPVPNSKCRYIPHGIDTEVFRPMGMVEREDIKMDIPDDSFKFLHVGANVASDRKKIFLLIDVFNRFLNEVDKDAVLMIFTDPTVRFPRGMNYDEFVGRLDIRNNVIFPRIPPRLDPWTDKEMASLYSHSDIYISASESEGFGLPLVESCACGVPVIAPDNSAQTEHVRGSGGFLVENCGGFVNYANYTPFGQKNPVPDMNSLFDNMCRAYNSDLDKMESKARRYGEKYEIRGLVEKWRNFFDEAAI